ncbi:DUF2065 domain-containing protein [Methylobacillus flagellatus]|uniref:DUF2065 domain-containing protein n=1 Tax=Methylobacillus flagellatus TaxID=405 RepID=UPI0010FA01EA|nr:DUF2065 domain-containing protein [Methylobacillus flagellatus]
MMTTLLMALGLMLVLEGLMPLLAPQTWRQTFERMLTMNNGQLRFVGILSILFGLLLLAVAN